MINHRQRQRWRRGIRLVPAAGFLLVCLWMSRPPHAQQQGGEKGTAPFTGFDIISVKPSKPDKNSWSIDSRDTMFEAKNASLTSLLANAYGMRESLITGLPKWAESSRWDISAKIIDGAAEANEDHLTREQSEARYHEKVQSILRERSSCVCI